MAGATDLDAIRPVSRHEAEAARPQTRHYHTEDDLSEMAKREGLRAVYSVLAK